MTKPPSLPLEPPLAANAEAFAPRIMRSLVIEPLARHPEALPALRRLFESEWPAWYGAGAPGDAAADLLAYASAAGLPYGVVALLEGEMCGVAALKAESIPGQRHRSPWAAAGVVATSMRGRGIGSALLAALEARARSDGHAFLHCLTGTAESLLGRRGYRLLERVVHEGQDLGVYRRDL